MIDNGIAIEVKNDRYIQGNIIKLNKKNNSLNDVWERKKKDLKRNFIVIIDGTLYFQEIERPHSKHPLCYIGSTILIGGLFIFIFFVIFALQQENIIINRDGISYKYDNWYQNILMSKNESHEYEECQSEIKELKQDKKEAEENTEKEKRGKAEERAKEAGGKQENLLKSLCNGESFNMSECVQNDINGVLDCVTNPCQDGCTGGPLCRRFLEKNNETYIFTATNKPSVFDFVKKGATYMFHVIKSNIFSFHNSDTVSKDSESTSDFYKNNPDTTKVEINIQHN